jgi:septal ring factor EnvC (AmiA/AmiB activator)
MGRLIPASSRLFNCASVSRNICCGTDFPSQPDTSNFDVTTPRETASRRGNLVAALLLGLLLVGGFIALWVAYGSAPPQQLRTDVAAASSNEATQAIKDLQTSQQKIAGQLQSLQETLASNQAETKQLADKVTALSGKLDALQQSFASAQQQSSPAPSEPAPAPAKSER